MLFVVLRSPVKVRATKVDISSVSVITCHLVGSCGTAARIQFLQMSRMCQLSRDNHPCRRVRNTASSFSTCGHVTDHWNGCKTLLNWQVTRSHHLTTICHGGWNGHSLLSPANPIFYPMTNAMLSVILWGWEKTILPHTP